jgi:hypothetical protein
MRRDHLQNLGIESYRKGEIKANSVISVRKANYTDRATAVPEVNLIKASLAFPK